MKTNKGKEDETPRDAFFFAAKAQKEIDALWDNDTINEDTINQWGAEHMRTPIVIWRHPLRRPQTNRLAEGRHPDYTGVHCTDLIAYSPQKMRRMFILYSAQIVGS